MQSFIALCILLGIGHVLRMRVRLLQRLYLPSCVIAGLVGLAWLQIAPQAGWDIPASWTAGWTALPGVLISVVFAGLFLGVRLPGVREMFRRAGPQLAYGQTVAWGQYVVGVGVFMLILAPLYPHLPAMLGAIVPVGFEGGHGTAAGMAPVFESLGWPEGREFGLASATAGMVAAIIVGMALVNWAVRRGHSVCAADPADVEEDDSIGVIPVDRRPIAGRLTVQSDAIEAFSLHLVVVGLAVAVGYGLKAGMEGLAGLTGWQTAQTIAASFPVFPLAMLGGLLIQVLEQRFDRHRLLDAGLMRRIQNAALDFLVIAAIATIRLEALREGLVPFLVIVAAGIGWNVFCVTVLARRLLPDAWFERSIAEMGQSMGVTATGLVLLRVVDPDNRTPALDAFGSKQLLHEPFMGGGLWTSAAVPLLAMWGPWPVFLIACVAVVGWVGLLTLGKVLTVRRTAAGVVGAGRPGGG